ncbi:energy transducer TonB [Desulfovibrio sp. OttesenSCG-928-M14]|nr:energy transducer TonB [Desulfovibrio sp. OttesenSCG-928-M14]
MNTATMSSLPDLTFPTGETSRGFLLKPSASACSSLALHILLLGLVILATLGAGAGGGASGGGADTGAGLGGPVFISGILTLPSASGSAENASPLPADEAPAVTEATPQPTADAVPIPAQVMPKEKSAPKTVAVRQEKKSVSQSARAARSTASPAETKVSSGINEGSGDGQPSGGGSGIHSGSGGNAKGSGSQGTGFLGKVDSKPRVLSRSKVKYPEMARKHKISGHVLLRFYLDEQGGLSGLQVVKAEPPGVFEDAALASVKEWRFAPAMKDGRPVPYWVELPMPFILK